MLRKRRVVLPDGKIRYFVSMSPEEVKERDLLNQKTTAEALRKRAREHRA